MAKIVWTPRARNDLIRLRDFLDPQSAESARRAVQTIREKLRTLRIAPAAGKPVDWLPVGYHEWFIPFGKSGYLVLYRLFEDQVVVQALRHARESGYPSG